MWGEKAAVPVHALHFCFGIGALLTPQLSRPFIYEMPPDGMNQTNVSTTAQNLTTINPTFITDRIEIPYGIIGAVTCTCGIIFIIIFIFCPRPVITNEGGHSKKKKKNMLTVINPKSMVGQYGAFGYQMLACMLVYFALPVGAERAYGKFIYSFATKSSLKFNKDGASSLNTVFWAAFTAGRGLSTLLATKLHPTVLLVLELSLNVISAVVLASCSLLNPIILWVFSSLFAACLSPMFPAGIIWFNSQLPLSTVATSIAFVGSALGAMLFSWLSGYLFEYHGPPSLMYLMVGYAGVLTALCLLMFLLANLYRFKKEKVLQDLADGASRDELAPKHTETKLSNSNISL